MIEVFALKSLEHSHSLQILPQLQQQIIMICSFTYNYIIPLLTIFKGLELRHLFVVSLSRKT